MTDDWKVQANFRFGAPNSRGEAQNLLNLRADNVDELIELLAKAESAVVAFGKLDGVISEEYKAGAVIGAAFPGAQVIGQQSAGVDPNWGAQPPGPPRTCAHVQTHGPMQWRADPNKQYRGWFCPLPKGTQGKCAAFYPDKQR